MKHAFSLLLMLSLCATAALAGRPVARWDIVPDQLIDSTFKVGVVAFHVDGVEVEFRVNSTLVATATDPTYNDRTGVWEFWFSLDPSSYADGALSIDARCVALNGTDPDYDLPTYTLYANSGGTLGSAVETWADSVDGDDANPGTEALPYATLAKAVQNTPSGGTIHLEAGSYSPASLGGGSTRPYWTTIRPADGVSRSQVVIGHGRPSTQRLRWQDVSFIYTYTGSYDGFLIGENGNHSLWADGCYFENPAGRWNGSLQYFTNRYVAYVTGGESHDLSDGPGARLIRDHTINTLKSDAWSGGNKLVVNSAVIDIDAGSTGAHPDFHQSYTTAPNFVTDVILYNVRGIDCDCQGLFGSRLKDSAFVNVLFERVADTPAYSQYSGPMENVLFAHISLVRQTWLWRGSGDNAYTATDVYSVNNIFNSMSFYEDAVPQAELVIDYNHFGGTPQGTNYTTGSIMYLDIDNNDFRIDPASPAAGTASPMQCVPADIDGDLFDTTSPNHGCYSGVSINTPPVADAVADQSVTDADADGLAAVTLDGSGSSDSDGSIVGYAWSEDGSPLTTGATPTVNLPVGVHEIDLTVTDDDSATDEDAVTVTVYSRTLTTVTGPYNWPINALPQQTGVFTVEFDAVPNGNNMDAVIGICSGEGDWWTDLAAITRFNDSGYVDVRNGSAYAADISLAYTASTSYHVRMVIDVPDDSYSVYVTPSGQSEVLLAEDYGFRTEQVGVGSLDHWTANTTIDTVTVSNLTITDQ